MGGKTERMELYELKSEKKIKSNESSPNIPLRKDKQIYDPFDRL